MGKAWQIAFTNRKSGAFWIVLALASAQFTPGLAGEYLDELVLKDVARHYEDDGQFDPGHTEFELVHNFRYRDDDGELWVVPAGVVVNGASIPRGIWSVIGGPWSGKYRRASVIHDHYVVTKSRSSQKVNEVFYFAMVDDQTAKWKAKLMYFAVERALESWKLVGEKGLRGEDCNYGVPGCIEIIPEVSVSTEVLLREFEEAGAADASLQELREAAEKQRSK